MLEMARKKKQTFQFLFSTTDVNFDPSTVSVIDSKSGKELKVESMVKAVRKRKEKIFDTSDSTPSGYGNWRVCT